MDVWICCKLRIDPKLYLGSKLIFIRVQHVIPTCQHQMFYHSYSTSNIIIIIKIICNHVSVTLSFDFILTGVAI